MSDYSKMNGKRVKHPNKPAIYLIDAGMKRLIPDEATYNTGEPLK